MAEEAKQIFRSEGEFQIWNLTKKKEITPYTTSCTWTGALECAARSIDFSIAYTTPKKDASFQNLKIELGDRAQMRFIDNNKKEFRLFEGNVFLRNRNSESYTMEFKAFDDMIYLAKSEVQMKFSKMPGADIIRQVCGTFGINVGTIHEDFNTECDFIADGITATEVINKCCKECEARYGYKYKAVMLPDKNGKQVLNVVRADGSDTVANYKISDTTNLERAQHGESIVRFLHALLDFIFVLHFKSHSAHPLSRDFNPLYFKASINAYQSHIQCQRVALDGRDFEIFNLLDVRVREDRIFDFLPYRTGRLLVVRIFTDVLLQPYAIIASVVIDAVSVRIICKPFAFQAFIYPYLYRFRFRHDDMISVRVIPKAILVEVPCIFLQIWKLCRRSFFGFRLHSDKRVCHSRPPPFISPKRRGGVSRRVGL